MFLPGISIGIGHLTSDQIAHNIKRGVFQSKISNPSPDKLRYSLLGGFTIDIWMRLRPFTFQEETIGVDCITHGKYGYVDPTGESRNSDMTPFKLTLLDCSNVIITH